jgi:hypothetical protein
MNDFEKPTESHIIGDDIRGPTVFVGTDVRGGNGPKLFVKPKKIILDDPILIDNLISAIMSLGRVLTKIENAPDDEIPIIEKYIDQDYLSNDILGPLESVLGLDLTCDPEDPADEVTNEV